MSKKGKKKKKKKTGSRRSEYEDDDYDPYELTEMVNRGLTNLDPEKRRRD